MRPFLRALRGYPTVPPGVLDRAEARAGCERLDAEDSHEMLRRTVELVGDDDLGLRAARELEIGEFGLIEYLVGSAASWHAALDATVRYGNIVDEALNLTLRIGRPTAQLVFGLDLGRHRASIDFHVGAFYVAMARWMQPMPRHLQVHFRHAAPACPAQYAETFAGAELVFASEADAIVFDAELLELPLPSADPTVHGLLRTRAERLLEAVAESEDDWLRSVRSDILAHLAAGPVTVVAVARRLAVSRRTLARRLRARETSFSEQVQSVRRRTAEHYLRRTDHTVGEIAFMLGFSEAPPFVRAFRRWTGAAPQDFRRRHAG